MPGGEADLWVGVGDVRVEAELMFSEIAEAVGVGVEVGGPGGGDLHSGDEGAAIEAGLHGDGDAVARGMRTFAKRAYCKPGCQMSAPLEGQSWLVRSP